MYKYRLNFSKSPLLAWLNVPPKSFIQTHTTLKLNIQIDTLLTDICLVSVQITGEKNF